MSKTNDTSKLNHATLDDHDTLADSELGAVTGGTKAGGEASASFHDFNFTHHVDKASPYLAI
jgi:type VI protein secretion system component Hcp